MGLCPYIICHPVCCFVNIQCQETEVIIRKLTLVGNYVLTRDTICETFFVQNTRRTFLIYFWNVNNKRRHTIFESKPTQRKSCLGLTQPKKSKSSPARVCMCNRVIVSENKRGEEGEKKSGTKK